MLQRSAQRRRQLAPQWCSELQFPQLRVRAVRHQKRRLRPCLRNDGSGDASPSPRAAERDEDQAHEDRRASSFGARPSSRRVDDKARPRSLASPLPTDQAKTPNHLAASRTQLKLYPSTPVARTVAPSLMTLVLLDHRRWILRLRTASSSSKSRTTKVPSSANTPTGAPLHLPSRIPPTSEPTGQG